MVDSLVIHITSVIGICEVYVCQVLTPDDRDMLPGPPSPPRSMGPPLMDSVSSLCSPHVEALRSVIGMGVLIDYRWQAVELSYCYW